MNLQIAFQGGGARLALLIPIVEALLELEEKDREINVTRVSGASAGAIAAVLLAGKGNIPALVQYLRAICTDDGAGLKSIFPSISNLGYAGKFQLAKRLLWDKKPIGDEAGLSEVLGNALEAAGIKRGCSVGDLIKIRPCFLISVNLGRRDRDPAPPSSKLLQALMDSAGLPFIFRLTGDRLDGGILDNLPIDVLKSPESPGNVHGEIVAIAFDEPDFIPQPGNALELAASLLDTTMTFKTRASRDAVTSNHVYEVATNVGGIAVTSFDIDSFIKFMNDKNAYKAVKDDTKVWFRNFIKLKEQERTGSGKLKEQEERTGSGDAPEQIEVNRRLDVFQTNLRSVAEHNFRHHTLRVSETIFEVTAHGLETPDDPTRKPDVVRVIDKVRVGKEPLFMHAAVLFSGGASVVISRDYKVFDSKLEQVEFVAFDIPGETGAITWHLTIFLNPLKPSEEIYTIQQTYEVMDFMRPLHQNGVDYLAQEFVQAEITNIAEIKLCVPRTIGPLILQQGTPDQLATLNLPVDALAARKRPLVEGKFQKKAVVASCPVNYDAYVWRGENCKRGEALRVVYRKGKPASD
jgi:predicted acylesterase/phospholipase RssA